MPRVRARWSRARLLARLAEFARERLGMSPRKAQALPQLERAGDLCPELRAAFRGGALFAGSPPARVHERDQIEQHLWGRAGIAEGPRSRLGPATGAGARAPPGHC